MARWQTHAPVAAFLAFGLTSSGPAQASRPGDPEEQDFGYRSHASEIADEVRINRLAAPGPAGSGSDSGLFYQRDESGLYTQVDDPALHHSQDVAISNRPV